MLKIIKKYKYIITFIVILIVICCVFIRSNTLKENNKEYVATSDNILVKDVEIITEEVTNVTNRIKIDIKGQVNNPGVYELNENSRVIDAVNIAGGLTDIANTSLINLSKKLEDQMVIIIYSDEEVLNSNVKEIETVFKVVEKECVCPNIKNDSCINTELDEESESNEIININTASLEQLMTLPSVGEAKAKAIIEYREENMFNTIEDIKNVSGIGDSLFEKIKEYITV